MLQSLTFRFLSAVLNLLIRLIRFRIAAVSAESAEPGAARTLLNAAIILLSDRRNDVGGFNG